MKNLTLLNDNTNIKLNDTGTVIQFKASNEGQPVGLSNGQSAVFRIKNELGFLKSVTANTTYGGYVFELDTEDLKGLVPDTYQVELLVQVDSDNALIFPDKGFVQFSINANALNITGEQLPVMSLDDFKDELKTYVDNQTTQATNNIKNDFDTYVDDLTNNTVATATKASQDATNAVNTANTAKSTADTATNKANANANLITSLNNTVRFLTGIDPLDEIKKGSQDYNDFNAFPFGVYYINSWYTDIWHQINNRPSWMENGYFVYEKINQGGRYLQIVYDQNTNIYIQILNLNNEVTVSWRKFTGTAI